MTSPKLHSSSSEEGSLPDTPPASVFKETRVAEGQDVPRMGSLASGVKLLKNLAKLPSTPRMDAGEVVEDRHLAEEFQTPPATLPPPSRSPQKQYYEAKSAKTSSRTRVALSLEGVLPHALDFSDAPAADVRATPTRLEFDSTSPKIPRLVEGPSAFPDSRQTPSPFPSNSGSIAASPKASPGPEPASKSSANRSRVADKSALHRSRESQLACLLERCKNISALTTPKTVDQSEGSVSRHLTLLAAEHPLHANSSGESSAGDRCKQLEEIVNMLHTVVDEMANCLGEVSINEFKFYKLFKHAEDECKRAQAKALECQAQKVLWQKERSEMLEQQFQLEKFRDNARTEVEELESYMHHFAQQADSDWHAALLREKALRQQCNELLHQKLSEEQKAQNSAEEAEILRNSGVKLQKKAQRLELENKNLVKLKGHLKATIDGLLRSQLASVLAHQGGGHQPRHHPVSSPSPEFQGSTLVLHNFLSFMPVRAIIQELLTARVTINALKEEIKELQSKAFLQTVGYSPSDTNEPIGEVGNIGKADAAGGRQPLGEPANLVSERLAPNAPDASIHQKLLGRMASLTFVGSKLMKGRLSSSRAAQITEADTPGSEVTQPVKVSAPRLSTSTGKENQPRHATPTSVAGEAKMVDLLEMVTEKAEAFQRQVPDLSMCLGYKALEIHRLEEKCKKLETSEQALEAQVSDLKEALSHAQAQAKSEIALLKTRNMTLEETLKNTYHNMNDTIQASVAEAISRANSVLQRPPSGGSVVPSPRPTSGNFQAADLGNPGDLQATLLGLEEAIRKATRLINDAAITMGVLPYHVPDMRHHTDGLLKELSLLEKQVDAAVTLPQESRASFQQSIAAVNLALDAYRRRQGRVGSAIKGLWNAKGRMDEATSAVKGVKGAVAALCSPSKAGNDSNADKISSLELVSPQKIVKQLEGELQKTRQMLDLYREGFQRRIKEQVKQKRSLP